MHEGVGGIKKVFNFRTESARGLFSHKNSLYQIFWR
nr:MAG TPA: hypothetical protein [Caudoviricetes sp.]